MKFKGFCSIYQYSHYENWPQVEEVPAYCELLESTFANSSVQNLKLSVEDVDSEIIVRLINALRYGRYRRLLV
jgi:hypothetical protein